MEIWNEEKEKLRNKAIYNLREDQRLEQDVLELFCWSKGWRREGRKKDLKQRKRGKEEKMKKIEFVFSSFFCPPPVYDFAVKITPLVVGVGDDDLIKLVFKGLEPLGKYPVSDD